MASVRQKPKREIHTKASSDRSLRQLATSKPVKIMSLALVAFVTPYPNSIIRGLAGFGLLVAVALLVSMMERQLDSFLANFRRGLSGNRLTFILSVWYMLGVVGNVAFRGGGLPDWRLMMTPVFLVFGFFLALAIYHEEECARRLLFMLLIVTGIQSVYTFFGIISDPSIAREMYVSSEGSWEYGVQSTFGLYAILLPVFLWRSLLENGMKKIVLLMATTMTLLALSISTLATPILLVVIHVAVIFLFSFLLVKSPKAAIRTLASGMVAALVIFVGYRTTRNLPDFAPIYYRIENMLTDPLSGGYAGTDVESSRLKKAAISIASFKERPFLGMGGGNIRSSYMVGGHSSLFDALGAYGLLGGGGALCAFMGSLLVNAFLRVKRERSGEALLAFSTVVSLVIAGIVNPYWEGNQPVYVMLLARPLMNRHATLKR